jgi:hypothetical protein
MAPDDMARADTLAADDRTMTALRLSLTLVAMFVGSLGAALGLYAAAFMGVHDDIDPFLRDIHQQSDGRRGRSIAAVFSAIDRLIKL